MSEIARITVNSNLSSVPQATKVVFTEIQCRLAQDEKVPLHDLPGITENDEKVLATVGVYTVYGLIFCANARVFQAFGGKGNSGTRRAVRRINSILYAHAFPRRISRREYLIQIEHIQKKCRT